MVSFNHVCQSNDRFALRQQDIDATQAICVFAGATSGIGAATVERLICMLHKPVFYIIGRSAKRFASQRTRLHVLNPSSKIIFLEAQFSLLSDVDSACKQIVASEEKVDYLFMSPGMIPVNGPEC
jgi:NADP-dependent 3-hydroxy acid dehydrogenase YdfG